YTVTYNVSDANGNAADEVVRTVNVVDTTIPVITLTGDATVIVEVGDTYTDAGATATDNYDGDLTASIITVNPVDTDTVGTYTVTYNVSDANGNAADEVVRTVNVVIVDTDGDGIKDDVDEDDDNDGQLDIHEIACGSDPLDVNSMSLDTDGDSIPDCVDEDDDNDGTPDDQDDFPLDPDEDTDTDGDGTGDNADTDDDNDGQLDVDEIACGSDPLDANSMSLDTDGDSVPDCVDTDDDGDGILDIEDNCPLIYNPFQEDLDNDGLGDVCDDDIDGDGISNAQELLDDTDPEDWCSSIPSSITMELSQEYLNADCDGDGLNNGDEIGPDVNNPIDSDGDGVLDYLEFNNHSVSEDDLEIFNLLTPNGDGKNDVFVIRNIELYPENTLEIYNRWGVKVYSVSGYGQNGKYFIGESGGRFTINSNSTLPSGTYFYILNYKSNGFWKNRKGYLNLTK
uniref:T9SS type B sorting domain-containing protein n=1 Tax=Polaribacter sp. TaxID=1920175 RepID=UPI0025CC9ACC